ncbi:MAG: hypothetical protein AAF960_27845 [Bacteroidota bacterium]
MADISFTKPLSFQLSITEIDDNLPSFKTEITVKANYLSSDFQFSAREVWFDCIEWEKFINSLEDISRDEEVKLADLDNKLIISLRIVENSFKFYLTYKSSSISNSNSVFFFEKILDEDEFAPFKESFLSFPIWW